MLNLTQTAGLAISTLAVAKICTNKKDESKPDPQISITHPAKSAKEVKEHVQNLQPKWRNIYVALGLTSASYVGASIATGTSTSGLDVSAYAENIAAVSSIEEIEEQLRLLDDKQNELELMEVYHLDDQSSTERIIKK